LDTNWIYLMNNKLEFSSKTFLQIGQLLGLLDTFKGNWVSIKNTEKKYLNELRQLATVASVGSSTRIEGVTLTDVEIEKLLKSVKINKLEKRDEQEVVGYYEALKIILENYREIELSERYIHQLHGFLLKYSSKDQTHRGSYKQLSNKVVAKYPDGSERLIFNTTEPHLTSFEMQNLLQWTNETLKSNEMHPLIIIGMFVYEFLSIHPYQDGNGRLSRLLTTLFLLKNGYDFVQYISFEHIIESKKEAYYKALMEGQKNRYKTEEKIDEWILFFLNCLIELTERLKEKYAVYSKIKTIFNERQKAILEILKSEKTISIGILEKLTTFSRNTLKKDLSFFVKEGIILKTGSRKSVQYHILEN
jgi:Fic family protein